MTPARLRAVRWTELAIVFQGALHTLNPVKRIGWQIGEAITTHDPESTRRLGRNRCGSCSRSSASRRAASTTTRTSSPAVSASAS